MATTVAVLNGLARELDHEKGLVKSYPMISNTLGIGAYLMV